MLATIQSNPSARVAHSCSCAPASKYHVYLIILTCMVPLESLTTRIISFLFHNFPTKGAWIEPVVADAADRKLRVRFREEVEESISGPCHHGYLRPFLGALWLGGKQMRLVANELDSYL